MILTIQSQQLSGFVWSKMKKYFFRSPCMFLFNFFLVRQRKAQGLMHKTLLSFMKFGGFPLGSGEIKIWDITIVLTARHSCFRSYYWIWETTSHLSKSERLQLAEYVSSALVVHFINLQNRFLNALCNISERKHSNWYPRHNKNISCS